MIPETHSYKNILKKHKLDLLKLAQVAECSTAQSMEYPSCKGPGGSHVDSNILVVSFWTHFWRPKELTRSVETGPVHCPRSNSMENTLLCFQPQHMTRAAWENNLGWAPFLAVSSFPQFADKGYWGTVLFERNAEPPSLPLSTNSRDTKET